MHHTPPDWSRPHQTGYPPPHMNGTDLQLGQTLGQLLVHNASQTQALERICQRLEHLPQDIAQIMPKPTPSRAPIPLRDIIQLIMAAVIVFLAVIGKMTVLEAVGILGKPFGF